MGTIPDMDEESLKSGNHCKACGRQWQNESHENGGIAAAPGKLRRSRLGIRWTGTSSMPDVFVSASHQAVFDP
jgi:hypothetical protein